jgi:hypothetical protein
VDCVWRVFYSTKLLLMLRVLHGREARNFTKPQISMDMN